MDEKLSFLQKNYQFVLNALSISAMYCKFHGFKETELHYNDLWQSFFDLLNSNFQSVGQTTTCS